MDVAAWRREKRLELYAARKATTAEQRHNAARKIAGELDDHCSSQADADRTLLADQTRTQSALVGAAACAELAVLPAGCRRAWPASRILALDTCDALQSGVWGIPLPAKRDVVTPNLMIAPLLGFDRGRYRLGNGGGYFDRTLAARTDRPFVIGVGYASGELETIHPRPHDIPMDLILTERS